jgi:hypothetical protein
MKLIQQITESFSAEAAIDALKGTVQYAKEIQRGSLDTRSAISFLAGRLKAENSEMSKLLDELLKNTK